jgi:hypothetical protein
MSKRRQSSDSKSGGKPRIETQISRRKKARAVPPLESEWDLTTGHPPAALRMPPEKMRRTGERG